MKKYVQRSPFADPDAAARKLVEIANGVVAMQDGRIFAQVSAARSRLGMSTIA
jgi:hypothetical protein